MLMDSESCLDILLIVNVFKCICLNILLNNDERVFLVEEKLNNILFDMLFFLIFNFL